MHTPKTTSAPQHIRRKAKYINSVLQEARTVIAGPTIDYTYKMAQPNIILKHQLYSDTSPLTRQKKTINR